MKTLKTLFMAPLVAFYTAAYGQFNTIKQVKNLPQVQVDAATAGTKAVAMASPSPAIDATRFKPVAEPASTVVSLPLSRPVINSHFGYRVDPLTGKEKFHDGIDFRGYADSVMVIMPGEVDKVAYSRGLGNYIEVKHGDFKTTYGHLSLVMVREKMKLNAGTVIGITGSTGRSTGDHLHFAIRHRGQTVNPIPFLDIIYRTLELQAREKNSGN